jgi:hypothetical protein
MANVQAPSQRFSLNKQDLVAFLKNAAWFLAPTLLFLLADVIKAVPTWFADKPMLVVVLMYLLNRLTDLIRRWQAGK